MHFASLGTRPSHLWSSSTDTFSISFVCVPYAVIGADAVEECPHPCQTRHIWTTCVWLKYRPHKNANVTRAPSPSGHLVRGFVLCLWLIFSPVLRPIQIPNPIWHRKQQPQHQRLTHTMFLFSCFFRVLIASRRVSLCVSLLLFRGHQN